MARWPEYLFAGPQGLFISKSQVGQSETLSEELVSKSAFLVCNMQIQRV